MLNEIKQLADEIYPEVVRLRRTFHQNPELAFEEVETARLVADTLNPLEIPIRTGVAKTGVVATLTGNLPGPTVALRGDMDALPIEEQTGLEFASRNTGKMHACGHDVHTSSLLGTAMILSRLKDRLAGTVRFVFQPSEELLPGGAKIMMEEGVLRDMDGAAAPSAIFGQHVQPDLPVGKIGIRSGMYMASADEIYLTVRGTGGHAAAPHRLQGDPVLASAQIIVALQSVISRHCPPDIPSVLSFGKVIAAGATNVIPEEVQIAGTFRAMEEGWRFRAHEHIHRVARHTAEAYGVTVDVNVAVGYPALYNHPAETRIVRDAALQYVGAENTVDLEQWFASEDFAWYLQQTPGAFYRLGTMNEAAGITHGLHTPRFTVDEEALRLAPGFMAFLALSYLQDYA